MSKNVEQIRQEKVLRSPFLAKDLAVQGSFIHKKGGFQEQAFRSSSYHPLQVLVRVSQRKEEEGKKPWIKAQDYDGEPRAVSPRQMNALTITMSALFSEYTSAAGEIIEVSSWIRMVGCGCELRPTMMDRGDPVTLYFMLGRRLVSCFEHSRPHKPYGIDG
ncbi:hypothetical protein PAAG_02098 [Paracoccidioides lutzii Pb01]|uniref:Uncharacterized protein n=1 Tax=Paracoccidioides lutzii (strain ATCC MYA-826 / Pb01) TaxID=502779 RepID=C1GUA3_PARBA|nr:hypothetical protein PAAG_02098 [Paracoccidioides lutzii Pb01]EEH39909.2 hypothetical protein PAAG_02098 [Paracoccidioides lutzii Pb01]